jgi:hypothetical protein
MLFSRPANAMKRGARRNMKAWMKWLLLGLFLLLMGVIQFIPDDSPDSSKATPGEHSTPSDSP